MYWRFFQSPQSCSPSPATPEIRLRSAGGGVLYAARRSAPPTDLLDARFVRPVESDGQRRACALGGRRRRLGGHVT